MALQRLIEPAALPLSVIEARGHVRQGLTVDDVFLDIYLRAASEFAQTRCGRSLVATRWKLTLDGWPPHQEIQLENGPVLAVQSVKYLDYSGVQQTVATSVYTTDLTGLPGRLAPKFGQIWQPALPQIGAVEVVFDAGDVAAITANPGTDVLTIVGGIWKTLAVLDTVRLSNSGGALPAPLAPDTDYYVQSLPQAGQFKLSATSGGAAIDLTDAGTGISYIGTANPSVRGWLLARVGGMFENREDATIVQRGTLLQVPYIDRMLDSATCFLN